MTDPEMLAVAMKAGETYILKLTDNVQGAVAQEGVTIDINCLSWVLQNPVENMMVHWTFIQLDEDAG